MESDDELVSSVASSRTNKAPPFNLDLDDAFTDTDDQELPFEFSPQYVREEIAKSHNPLALDLAEEISTKAEYSADANASVSTFDINGSDIHEPASPPNNHYSSLSSLSLPQPSQESTHTLDDSQLSSDFSQISLSSPSGSADVDNDQHSATYPAAHVDDPHPYPQPDEIKIQFSSVEDVTLEPDVPHEPHSPMSASPQPSASVASTSSTSIPAPLPHPTPVSPQPITSPQFEAIRHRNTRSMGPSMLDKVVSKTRPNFLPPKSRVEDKKHMADWESMMKHSRVAEEKRHKELQERRLTRERKIEESIAIWERDILPDWRVVHKKPALRKLWWEGIPTKLRATMWQNAVGNSLSLGKDAFKTCLARAKRALASGSFPTTVLGLLEDDIAGTLPSLHLFRPQTGPLYEDLRDMLCAWVVSRSDEGLGYVPGIAKIAAMLLINMPPAQGFITMRNLLDRHCMRSFYGGMASKDDVEAYYRIFDTLLADGMPKIYFNFKQHQLSPSAYLPDWLIPLFLNHLPFEACARLWDILLLEGDSFLYRAALGILAVLEPRLFFPDRRELLELLRGENKAALEVAKRSGRPLNGAIYDIYGVDEETLWERIDSMEDWWKESTWTRLIQRELPDL